MGYRHCEVIRGNKERKLDHPFPQQTTAQEKCSVYPDRYSSLGWEWGEVEPGSTPSAHSGALHCKPSLSAFSEPTFNISECVLWLPNKSNSEVHRCGEKKITDWVGAKMQNW